MGERKHIFVHIFPQLQLNNFFVSIICSDDFLFFAPNSSSDRDMSLHTTFLVRKAIVSFKHKKNVLINCVTLSVCMHSLLKRRYVYVREWGFRN